MTCPSCSSSDTQVCETRPRAGSTRRRRHCNGCHRKFTTCEVVVPDGRSDYEIVAVRKTRSVLG